MKGFGFIECPDAMQQFGRDVCMRKVQTHGIHAGMYVTFTLECSREGMPAAHDVLPLPSAPITPSPQVVEGEHVPKACKGFPAAVQSAGDFSEAAFIAALRTIRCVSSRNLSY